MDWQSIDSTIGDRALRYGTFVVIALLTVLFMALAMVDADFAWPLVVLAPLALLGCYDLLQQRHTLMRNYPVVAHIRWLFETVRPYIRQYLLEGDLTGQPFNHQQRALVYERAKDAIDVQPFGTELNVYGKEYEFITHSTAPTPVAKDPFYVTVGGSQCTHPYNTSVLNISAMSFGALGAHAIEALNLGAHRGGFYHDTGEGAISPHHLIHGGDLVWEVGSGYFGCRDRQGRFDPAMFAEQASRDAVKMVEIKLSQGAKPGHGGVLPGTKVTAEIASTRLVPVGEDCISPSGHSAFGSPVEMMEFVASLRELSGGKPVGIKLCVGHPWEVFAICKAMLKTGIRVDFIVVDGAEGGTGAAPKEFSDHIGAPLREGLVLVRNALVGTGLRSDIRIAASGKVSSGFGMAVPLAVGADWCNAARSFMFALGCVQSQRCHTGKCPTGVATHDRTRQRGLVVLDKAERVRSFHQKTVEALAEVVAAAGLDHPGQLLPRHIYRRGHPGELRTLDQIYDFIGPDTLIEAADSTPYADWWDAADADSFQPCQAVGPRRHD